MNDVRRQLIVDERNGHIIKWYDRKIPPGSEWRNQIDGKLQSAHVILLFMSPDFIKSKYCYEVEGKAALLRHQAGEARVIPIILRPCAWEKTPFGFLQALPKDAQPISRWVDRDEACLDAARGVMAVVDGLTKQFNLSPTKPDRSPPQPKDAKLIYCRKCGHTPGSQSDCHYDTHAFVEGSANVFCRKCGVRPGSKSPCVGWFESEHAFVDGLANAFCRQCGVRPGLQCECTTYSAEHEFVQSPKMPRDS